MNVKLYYIYSFLKNLVPVYPVYLILFQSRGLTFSEISLLLAVWSVPAVLLEMPTGILADRWSRKNMIVIGTFLHAACYIFWYFSEGFLLFALGFVLWGVGGAFCSGSVEALLYDSLKHMGREDGFDRVYGRGSFFSSISVAVSCLAGGFIAMTFSMEAVLVLSILFLLICTILAAGFKEVNYFRVNYRRNKETGAKDTYKILYDAFRFLIGSRGLLTVALLLVLVIGTADMLDEYDQLIAKGYGFNMGLVGVWGGLRHMLEGVGSRTAHTFKSLTLKIGIRDRFFRIWTICLAAALALGISGLTGSILFMPLYGLFYLAMASARILQEDYIQQKIQEQGRSTVHSIISLVQNIYGAGFFGIFALVLSGQSVFGLLVITAAYIAVVNIVLSIMYLRYKRQTPF